MEKKNPYEEPEILFVAFSESDIITSSGGNNIGEDDGENDGEWM